MSVLLEALKKAAENKKQGAETESASETVPVENAGVKTPESEPGELDLAAEKDETVEPDLNPVEAEQEVASPLSGIQLIQEAPSDQEDSGIKSIDDLELEFSQEKDDESRRVQEKVEPIVVEEPETELTSVLSKPFLKDDSVDTSSSMEEPIQEQEEVVPTAAEPLKPLDQTPESEQGEQKNASGESAEDSYAWSLSSLPGYGEGDVKEPTLSGTETPLTDLESKEAVPEQNSILSSDKRFRKYLPKSLRSMLFGRSSNYTVYTLLSVLVLSFLGLFGVLYYQDQTLKLEQSMHKYDLVKMEPYKAPAKTEEVKSPAATETEESKEMKLVEAEEAASSDEVASEPEPVAVAPEKPKAVQPAKKAVYTKTHIQPKEKKPTVVVNIETVPVEPYVQNAYQALYAGDLTEAEDLFKKALQDNVEDVDALNGLGAVYARMNQEDRALQQYYRVLEISSDNIHAFEAVISLVGSGLSGQEWKKEIKRVLVKHPDSSILNYALGNIYAGEGDWEKAQSSYFEAHRLDQQNPDYLVNLAISLDHLGQYELAEKYYTLGLVYSDSKITNFDVNQVKLRLASIKQYIGQNDL